MATLAADKNRKFGISEGAPNRVPCVATDIVYQGAAVGDSSGTGRPLVAGDAFLGFARAQADNSAGAASAIDIDLRTSGTVTLAVTSVASTDDVGATVYASDDDTFTLASTSNSAIGKIQQWLTSTTCVVYFEAGYRRSI